MAESKPDRHNARHPRDYGADLSLGAWFNRSSFWLRAAAVGTALAFLAFCTMIAYGVAQYFVCIGNCPPGTPSLALIGLSIILGLVPAVLTGGMGYFIVRGLWEDAQQSRHERAE